MFEIPIVTRRTRLRPVSDTDLEPVYAILGDPTTTAAVSWGQPSRESTAGWIRRRANQQRRYGFSMWAVELIETGDIVGLCGFFPHDGSKIELGYVIGADHWRKGLASEVVPAVLAAARREGVPVFATIRSTNVPSLAVARRAGLIETDRVNDDRGCLLVFVSPS